MNLTQKGIIEKRVFFIAMHKNGNIYAGVYSTKRKGFDNFGNQPIGTINNLFKGYTSLIYSAIIIRSSF